MIEFKIENVKTLFKLNKSQVDINTYLIHEFNLFSLSMHNAHNLLKCVDV